MFNNVFAAEHRIPDDCDVVFVADFFKADLIGGAELTSQAIIDESPVRVHTVHSSHVSMATLESGHQKIWVFGNFAGLRPELIPTIAANLRYVILEYDYKYCRYRSPEKHFSESGLPCACHNDDIGKLISSFYHGADALFWMSDKQKGRYETLFPFLAQKHHSYVLSSVFSKEDLSYIQSLDVSTKNNSWLVLGSNSWIKGTQDAIDWCRSKGHQYEVVQGLGYHDLLTKMATSKGVCYLPKGGDTCPRFVIEAKLLGCEIHVNDDVEHAKEFWFATKQSTLEKLQDSTNFFWDVVEVISTTRATISGYTTTYNCLSQGYPFIQSITSMLGFCEEVVVVDAGSTDGTLSELRELQGRDQRLKIIEEKVDWSAPDHSLIDGRLKALARKNCTQQFAWQMDVDEVVSYEDFTKIRNMAENLPKGMLCVSLPVVEWWGSFDKVRIDITPWKWRLTRNDPDVTHGVPRDLRRRDAQGWEYAAPGTDGCDLIFASSGERIPHVTFTNDQTEQARFAALGGNEEARVAYENWLNQTVNEIPTVFHYSWLDIRRKINLYKNFWSKHWSNLFRDSSESNKMFMKPWSDVTEDEISALADKLANETGGWVWHRPWDGSKVPHISINRRPKLPQ